MRAATFLAVALLTPYCLSAATVTDRNGKVVTGDIRGIIVQKEAGKDRIIYTLLPGPTITSIDASGVHVQQAPPNDRLEPGLSAVIKVDAPASPVDSSLELMLLQAAGSPAFKDQMDGLLTFRVKTGLSVSRSDDYQTTVSRAPFFGVLLNEPKRFQQSLTIDTATGPVTIDGASLPQ